MHTLYFTIGEMYNTVYKSTSYNLLIQFNHSYFDSYFFLLWSGRIFV